MSIALVVHGHFYQPPRESPWTEMIEREPSAQPFRNWNERIHSECYRPNAYARIIDSRGRVERIINNYSNLSFNFGPTLLTWLERQHPRTYARIIDADSESVARRGGHGNAIAQGYHHVILTLCNDRDRRTQIRWGVADFRHRFGRAPESLWLPETACNSDTLEALIEEGLAYVILSPHQAERVRPVGGKVWQSVVDGQIDPTVPYKYFHRDGSERSIAIFFYDGMIAKSVAFDGLLASSHTLVDRFERAVGHDTQLVNIATDGESYGHHFEFGDRCIAYALETEAAAHGFRVTNYGEFLAEHAPVWEVEIKEGPEGEGTAWSCAHGVGRWSRDCSCHAGALEGWNQQWREPLRAALDFLRDDAAPKFEAAAGDLFADPWAVRDAYVDLLVDRTHPREEFLRRHAKRPLSAAEQIRALTLLELQRSAMVMYTSCGWFFNDISGLETVQVLRYAGRALELMEELELAPPRAQFLDILSEAQSNLRRAGNGADIFRRTVETSRVTPPNVAAHIAMTGLASRDNGEQTGEVAGYEYRKQDFQEQSDGRLTLATGRVGLRLATTGREFNYALATMHFGDADYCCVLKPDAGEASFRASSEQLWSQFRTASLPVMLRLAQEEFGPEVYGLEHLLPQGRQHLSDLIFGSMVEQYVEQYEFLYEKNRRVIEVLQAAGFKLPKELRAAAEFTMSRRFEAELLAQQQRADDGDYRKALDIADEAARLDYRIDRTIINRLFEETMTQTVRRAVDNPSAENFHTALTLIATAKKLSLEANLEHAQEVVYEALQRLPVVSFEMRELALRLDLAPNILVSLATDATSHEPQISTTQVALIESSGLSY